MPHLIQNPPDALDLYRAVMDGRLPFAAYAERVAICETTGCTRPATELDRGCRRCAACAMVARALRRGRA